MTIIRQLSSSALRHLCTFCWFPAERMEMLKTNCHMGRRLHLRRRCFRQLDVNLPFCAGGFYLRQKANKKKHGILEAHVLQNSKPSPKEPHDWKSSKNPPQKQQPFIHLGQIFSFNSSKHLGFPSSGFSYLSWKKNAKNVTHPPTPLELSKGAPLKSPLCWISSTWRFPPGKWKTAKAPQ